MIKEDAPRAWGVAERGRDGMRGGGGPLSGVQWPLPDSPGKSLSHELSDLSLLALLALP